MDNANKYHRRSSQKRLNLVVKFGLVLASVGVISALVISLILPAQIDAELSRFDRELLPELGAGMTQISLQARQHLASKRQESLAREEAAFIREKTVYTKGIAAQLLPLVENYEDEAITQLLQQQIATVTDLVGAKLSKRNKDKWDVYGRTELDGVKTFRSKQKNDYVKVGLVLFFVTDVLDKIRDDDIASYENLLAHLDESTQAAISKVEQDTLELQTELSKNVRYKIALVIFPVVIAFIVVISLLLNKIVIKPLRDAGGLLNRIAEGDLTINLQPSGTDEVSQMLVDMNTMASNLRNHFRNITQLTSDLSVSAEQMSVITEDTNQAVQKQQRETNKVALLTAEMLVSIQDVTCNATQAAKAAQVANQKSQDGRSVVDLSISAIASLGDAVQKAEAVIYKLESDSASIGSVVDVIKQIAEQTNLLALNAAIEAARAGDQGRGFAVVADEVRMLAGRTQQSTAEIQAMIQCLQLGTKDAVQVMAAGTKQAKVSIELAAQVGTSLMDITDAVAAISDMNSQIVTAAEKQSVVVNDMNGNVLSISRVVEDTADSAKKTANAGESMTQLAEGLRHVVNQFKV